MVQALSDTVSLSNSSGTTDSRFNVQIVSNDSTVTVEKKMTLRCFNTTISFDYLEFLICLEVFK